jgi:hypothetical protein
MARQYWPGHNCLGPSNKTRGSLNEEPPPWFEIVGIVADGASDGTCCAVKAEMVSCHIKQVTDSPVA